MARNKDLDDYYIDPASVRKAEKEAAKAAKAEAALKDKKRLTFSGVLFILAACCFLVALGGIGYNLWLIRKVEMESNEMMKELLEAESGKTGEESGEESRNPIVIIDPEESGAEPEYVFDPNTPMPTKKVSGKECIGILSIPYLKLEYPIISTWNYTLLESAPCRFAGSLYSRDLIICAHNYTGTFGKIGTLPIGTELTFTDMAGNVFTFEVTEIRNLHPDALDEMLAGDWDMTLFTCTKGAKWRITVRCKLKNAVAE